MSINYKFIAVQNSQNCKTEMKHEKELENNTINYNQVKDYFLEIGKEYEIVEEDIINTKFIINNSLNMSLNEDTNFEVTSEEIKIIFVFTVENDTRAKLKKLFNDKGFVSEKKQDNGKKETTSTPDPEIVKPIPEDDIKITEEIINESNKKTIELFGDEDFKTLLSIYKSNPEIFKTFSSYVCNGDVIIESFEKKESESFQYDEQLQHIKSLDLSIDEDKIIDSLNRNNGHLNLSLRYILYNFVNDQKTNSIEVIE
tara:strand:- start:25 stop:792 length:768 start_codon:yes stop_codon:yes gene_type:complete